MKKLFYSIVLLFAASITLTSCDDRIVINSIQWASHNVKQPYTTISQMGFFTWEQAQTACPPGWRLPTREELQTLQNTNSRWESLRHYRGRMFGSRSNQVFLPAAGRLEFIGYFLRHDVNIKGFYWSSTPGPYENTAWVLTFDTHSVEVLITSRQLMGFQVRCVAR